MRRGRGVGSRFAGGVYQLNNLIAIVDVNRLGQSQATAFGHDLDVYRKRFEAFGWRTEEIDGHDLEEIIEVLAAVGLGDPAAGHSGQDATKARAFPSCRTRTAGTANRCRKEEAAQRGMPSCGPAARPASA